MKQSNKPTCQNCVYALRAAEGYVEGCGAEQTNDPIKIFGNCVMVATSGECDKYKPKGE